MPGFALCVFIWQVVFSRRPWLIRMRRCRRRLWTRWLRTCEPQMLTPGGENFVTFVGWVCNSFACFCFEEITVCMNLNFGVGMGRRYVMPLWLNVWQEGRRLWKKLR